MSPGLAQHLGHNRCPQSVYRVINETLTSGNGNEDREEMAFKDRKTDLPLQIHYVLTEWMLGDSHQTEDEVMLLPDWRYYPHLERTSLLHRNKRDFWLSMNSVWHHPDLLHVRKKIVLFCFVVLEKTLERPLDCKEIQLVHPKGDQSWVVIGRTDVECGIKAERCIFTPMN